MSIDAGAWILYGVPEGPDDAAGLAVLTFHRSMAVWIRSPRGYYFSLKQCKKVFPTTTRVHAANTLIAAQNEALKMMKRRGAECDRTAFGAGAGLPAGTSALGLEQFRSAREVLTVVKDQRIDGSAVIKPQKALV